MAKVVFSGRRAGRSDRVRLSVEATPGSADSGGSSRLALVTSGFGRELPAFIVCPMCAWPHIVACVNYWIISLWRKERPVRTMTPEMREKMFTLQMLLEYDLEDLRSRKEL